jgi:two-component system sensor histidine kinase HydH
MMILDKGGGVVWAPEGKRYKVLILGGLTALTLAVHYGWVLEPIFGHVHWFHAIHGRFCYIPIVMAAAWFGLRGGLYAASVISLLVLPLVLGREWETHELAGEIAEIVFYYFIAILAGALVDREFLARRRQQQAELQVERSQKLSLVGQIAAGVAHEIKNPLTSIKGAADILTDENTSDEEKQEFRGILHDEVRRIDNTVGEFLSFARPRKTVFKRMDLNDLLQTCIRQTGTQAKQEDISITSEMEKDVIISGDSEKLHQMVLNLILNSVQASPPGATIVVRLEKRKGTHAALLVSDSGSGIDESDLERVFEPFYTTRASGTGLGLAIVKTIIDNHGGEVRLENNHNQGTTATVILPLMEQTG